MSLELLKERRVEARVAVSLAGRKLRALDPPSEEHALAEAEYDKALATLHEAADDHIMEIVFLCGGGEASSVECRVAHDEVEIEATARIHFLGL